MPPSNSTSGGRGDMSSGGGNSHLDTIIASPSATPPMSCSTPGGSLNSGGSPTPGSSSHHDSPSIMGGNSSGNLHTSQDSGYMTPGGIIKSEVPGGAVLSSISSPISTSDGQLSSSTLTPAPSTPSSCSQLPQSTSVCSSFVWRVSIAFYSLIMLCYSILKIIHFTCLETMASVLGLVS